MTVWDDLVGQEPAVHVLQQAAASAVAQLAGGSADGAPAAAMTHAWLLTGPPGSGRSIAARAFAAALQCQTGTGCGTCSGCRSTMAGSHPDLRTLRTELLSISVGAVRDLVPNAARSPLGGRWHVLLVEDADRLTEAAANALLKAIEEPATRTVWLLCAPAQEDVEITIWSRCRHVRLRTPPVDAVAELLQRRNGIDPAMAHFAARASQGHIGRALRLAKDEHARNRRNEILRLPTATADLRDCLTAANNLVRSAVDDTSDAVRDLDAREQAEFKRALGYGTPGSRPARGAASAMKDLEQRQKNRATRLQRDAIDRSLLDLASFYRDVLALQLGVVLDLVNEESRATVTALAATSQPEDSVRRLEAILACRESIDASAAPLLAVEALTIALREAAAPA